MSLTTDLPSTWAKNNLIAHMTSLAGERTKNLSRSSINSKGQSSLEAESPHPNLSLRKWTNNDDLLSPSQDKPVLILNWFTLDSLLPVEQPGLIAMAELVVKPTSSNPPLILLYLGMFFLG